MHNLIMLKNSVYTLYSKAYITKRATHPTRKIIARSSLLQLSSTVLISILILITLFFKIFNYMFIFLYISWNFSVNLLSVYLNDCHLLFTYQIQGFSERFSGNLKLKSTFYLCQIFKGTPIKFISRMLTLSTAESHAFLLNDNLQAHARIDFIVGEPYFASWLCQTLPSN